MSKSDLLYVRNMSLSESEEEEENENEQDIWDDRKLNDAYDKALNIANAEVAKRLAMSTNTQPKDGSNSKKPAQNPPSKSQKKDKTKWRAGMHCRAVYEEDGIEYEALLMRIINDRECVVRFLGYENSEIVPVNSLKPSLGKRERNKQIEEALGDNLEDGFSVHSHTAEEMECSDRQQSPGSLESSKKKKSKKNKSKPSNGFKLPDLTSMPMPSIAHLKNIGAMDMPIPPPPPLSLPRHETDSEEQAVSSMLLSWYMSGYYTGLYQGIKRAREGRRH